MCIRDSLNCVANAHLRVNVNLKSVQILEKIKMNENKLTVLTIPNSKRTIKKNFFKMKSLKIILNEFSFQRSVICHAIL